MICVAAIVGLVTAFLVVPMRNLAIEAIYVLVVGFILIGGHPYFKQHQRDYGRKRANH